VTDRPRVKRCKCSPWPVGGVTAAVVPGVA
jgi:hypothetical protein